MPTLHAIGGDGVVADGGAGEQSAHGVGDGREGLVLGELAQPAGHRLAWRTNPLPRKTSRNRIIGVLLAVSTLLAAKPERDGQPDQREGEQGQDPDRGEPLERPGAGVESETEGDADEDGRARPGFGSGCRARAR